MTRECLYFLFCHHFTECSLWCLFLRSDLMFAFDETAQALSRTRSRTRSNSSGMGGSPGSPHPGGLGGRKSPRNANISPRSSISSMGVSLTSVSSVTAAAASHHSRRYLQWRSGFCTHIGPKATNEDTFVSMPYLNDRIADDGDAEFHAVQRQLQHSSGGGVEASAAYFAVFDGHSGAQAALYLQDNLLDKICSHAAFRSDLELAIGETCCATDLDVRNFCKADRLHCGTTALGAFIIRSRLVVFNIGDCQAVLCNKGLPVSGPVSVVS